MRTERIEEVLGRLIEQPRFQRSLLHNFDKGYSLGIGQDPEDPSELAVYLQVEGEDIPEVPDEVEVAGRMIRVIAKAGFRAPRPYAAHR